MNRNPQMSFEIRSHGGLRKNSGRKKTSKDELPHVARKNVDSRTPLHINFKLIRQVPSLRSPKFMRELSRIIANSRRRGLRIQQYTIESNHIHLIAEADNKDQVKRGMISLKVSIAWALRRIFMFHGKIFNTRYYIHLLKTPTEMRNALRYVLFNHAKHVGKTLFADEYSSVFVFEDHAAFTTLKICDRPEWFNDISRQLSESQSWMQRQGWRRAR